MRIRTHVSRLVALTFIPEHACTCRRTILWFYVPIHVTDWVFFSLRVAITVHVTTLLCTERTAVTEPPFGTDYRYLVGLPLCQRHNRDIGTTPRKVLLEWVFMDIVISGPRFGYVTSTVRVVGSYGVSRRRQPCWRAIHES
jgi:hypothetical protein